MAVMLTFVKCWAYFWIAISIITIPWNGISFVVLLYSKMYGWACLSFVSGYLACHIFTTEIKRLFEIWAIERKL